MLNLLARCFDDSQGFFLFFLVIMIPIGSFSKMTGIICTGKDYDGLPKFFVFLIETLRTAIGDIQAPDYAFFRKELDDQSQESDILAEVMIIIIWMVFLIFNIILMVIILNNALITIIGISYKEVLKKEETYAYIMKNKMNIELTQTFESFGAFKSQFDSIFLAYEKDKNQNEF